MKTKNHTGRSKYLAGFVCMLVLSLYCLSALAKSIVQNPYLSLSSAEGRNVVGNRLRVSLISDTSDGSCGFDEGQIETYMHRINEIHWNIEKSLGKEYTVVMERERNNYPGCNGHTLVTIIIGGGPGNIYAFSGFRKNRVQSNKILNDFIAKGAKIVSEFPLPESKTDQILGDTVILKIDKTLDTSFSYR